MAVHKRHSTVLDLRRIENLHFGLNDFQAIPRGKTLYEKILEIHFSMALNNPEKEYNIPDVSLRKESSYGQELCPKHVRRK
jgi:hypothetical protein